MVKTLQGVPLKAKETAKGLAIYLLKGASGAFWGLIFAMIFQEILGFGAFSFSLVVVAVLLAFLRLSKNWSLGIVGVFNLILVLLGLLIRMYITVAPGA